MSTKLGADPSVMNNLRDLGKNPILEQAWSRHNYLDQDELEQTRQDAH
ncbi:hypothetical protein [Compostimonas suwonensis]|uniref:Uncharacterized protein n=1 Tax=Compostimonas suwonensis TaxID=1048394 RepID=A0A2M9C0N4_9MICO|nr:hypothetical protein [Compostimonas suwonensis]PJJ63875.1 hypothetical protein CLV54_1554 [Compostimonas suwonensis]